MCFGDIVEFENKSILGEILTILPLLNGNFIMLTGTINGTSQQLPSNPPLSNDLIQNHDYSQNITSSEGTCKRTTNCYGYRRLYEYL